MGDKKNSKSEQDETFSYKDEEDNQALKKFDRRKWIFLGLGGVTIVSLIILGTIFFHQPATFALIFSFYCVYLWILPLIAAMLRTFKVNLHIKHESKIGRIFMFFGVYFLFLWVTGLVGLLIYLGGIDITVIAQVVFWGSTCVFAPVLLFILITRL